LNLGPDLPRAIPDEDPGGIGAVQDATSTNRYSVSGLVQINELSAAMPFRSIGPGRVHGPRWFYFEFERAWRVSA
jgi:hypothetical protein